jgi:hypothetical protein
MKAMQLVRRAVVLLTVVAGIGCSTPTAPALPNVQTPVVTPSPVQPQPVSQRFHKEWNGVFPAPSEYNYSFSDRYDFELPLASDVSVAVHADCDMSATYPHLIMAAQSVADPAASNVYAFLDSPTRDAVSTARFAPGVYVAIPMATGSWTGCGWRMTLDYAF